MKNKSVWNYKFCCLRFLFQHRTSFHWIECILWFNEVCRSIILSAYATFITFEIFFDVKKICKRLTARKLCVILLWSVDMFIVSGPFNTSTTWYLNDGSAGYWEEKKKYLIKYSKSVIIETAFKFKQTNKSDDFGRKKRQKLQILLFDTLLFLQTHVLLPFF